jgi:hypothetical protein
METRMMSSKIENEFARLVKWIGNRLYNPANWVTMFGYFLGTVIIFGGAGVWWAVIHLLRADLLIRDELLVSMLSFAWAIAGASWMDFQIGEKENFVRVFPVFISIVLIVLTVASLLWTLGQYVFAVLAMALAAFVWWIANAENPKFANVEPQSLTGGDVTKKVEGLEGDMKL